MEWANAYVGLPWLDGGRTKAGCDCYGLVRIVAQERFGITLDRHDQFYTSIEGDHAVIASKFQEELSRWCWRKLDPAEIPMPGDVAEFVVAGKFFHCGVMLNDHLMLHIRPGANAIIDSLHSLAWAKRLRGIYRYV